MISTRAPLFFRVSQVKYLPTPNAMNASATSVTNDMLSTIDESIHFRQ